MASNLVTLRPSGQSPTDPKKPKRSTEDTSPRPNEGFPGADSVRSPRTEGDSDAHPHFPSPLLPAAALAGSAPSLDPYTTELLSFHIPEPCHREREREKERSLPRRLTWMWVASRGRFATKPMELELPGSLLHCLFPVTRRALVMLHVE